MPQLKVVFRGDSRSPIEDNIFGTGFIPRDTSLDPRMAPTEDIYAANERGGGDITGAGDVQSDTVVCVTANFRFAPALPFTAATSTYVYVAGVDVGKLFNTHQVQYRDGLVGLTKGTAPADAFWPLFAEELAIVQIASSQIIGAVAVTRQPSKKKAAWSAGVTYQLGEVYENPACTLPEDFVAFVKSRLRMEYEQNRSGRTPALTTGFLRSDPRWVPPPPGALTPAAAAAAAATK